jgi:hypothetical protein
LKISESASTSLQVESPDSSSKHDEFVDLKISESTLASTSTEEEGGSSLWGEEDESFPSASLEAFPPCSPYFNFDPLPPRFRFFFFRRDTPPTAFRRVASLISFCFLSLRASCTSCSAGDLLTLAGFCVSTITLLLQKLRRRRQRTVFDSSVVVETKPKLYRKEGTTPMG